MIFWRRWVLARPVGPALAQLQKHGTLSAPFYDAAGVHADPSFRLRGLWTAVESANSIQSRFPGRHTIMERTPWQLRRPAPGLGEHNADVFMARCSDTTAETWRGYARWGQSSSHDLYQASP